MKSRWLLAASALFCGALGLAATFLPQELLSFVHVTPTAVLTLLIQILGALYFAFAMQNWMAKDSLIGGIYNRPLAIANLVHFLIAALALVKGVMAGQRDVVIVTMAVVYALFAIAFARLVFTSPVDSSGLR